MFKSTGLLALGFLLSGQAFGAGFAVDCKPPKGFAGVAATVSGELKKTGDVKEGNEMVAGSLSVFLGGSTPKPAFKKSDVKVEGALLIDGSLHLAGGKDMTIYINPARHDVSNVEYRGSFYKMECSLK